MKSYLRFLFFSLQISFFLLPGLTLAQTTINGQVLDARSQQPLEGVSITANSGEQSISSSQGQFTLSADEAERVTLTLLGYKSQQISLTNNRANLRILLQPEATRLQEVLVTGYENKRLLLETAGAISVINQSVLQRFDESSVVRAVNTVPGIRMDERAPASYRISIRGSSLRSPYGIRNVKLYFNGLPLTEANGTTSLNTLDAANIGSIEILKGPTASIYGAGTGGTILLESRRAAVGETQLQVGATTGSYGFRRYLASVSTGSAKSNVLVQYTRQQYDGYREQSAVDRHVLLVAPEFYVSPKHTIAASIIYSDLYYELPGGITKEQYDQNPRQARGGMFGSVAQNASMNQDGFNFGLKQEYTFNQSWQNTTSIYTLHRFRDHPFNTDYERNTNLELGGRTSFKYKTQLGSIATNYTFGGEVQRGLEAARTYDNIGGQPDSLRTDDEVTATTGFVFGQAELELPSNFILTLALSANDTKYEIDRLAQATSGAAYTYVKDFKTILSPRIAVLKKLSDQISAHASISSGFSPPTEEEILTSDGELNEDLEAEKGVNYEAGFRGYTLNNRLSFDVVGFYFRLSETIVSQQQVSSVAVFRNAGATSQKGIETALSYTLFDDPEKALSLFKVWGSYTYNHFRFKDFTKGEADLAGNEITGVAPHTATAGLDLATKLGLYFNLTANYTSEIPLNDENTIYADSYFILGSRVGLRRNLGNHLAFEVFGGADNLTDQKYSLGNDINAFGARYYQPAPDRTYYGGLTLKYRL